MKNLGGFRLSICKILCGIFLIAVCLVFSGCAANNAAAWREYKVYCGMSSRNGEVSEEAWRRFCAKYVSTAFPDGYTVIDATGYWRSAPNTTSKERTKILLIVAPADARAKVLLVAEQYRKQFDQDSILVSCSSTEADFVQGKQSQQQNNDSLQ